MFSANVQTDTGESLPITHLDGHFAGKPILSFIMGILAYRDRQSKDGSPPEPSEFDRLSPHARDTLCIVCAGLMRATVNSDWDYREGEDYKRYLKRTRDYDLGEDAFMAASAHYQAAWTDIHTLIALVQTVIVQLEMAPPVDQSESLTGTVRVDFRALHDTLVVALSRGAKRARIDIH